MHFSNFYRLQHNYYILFLVKLQLILQFFLSNIYPSGAYYIGYWKNGDRHGNGEYHFLDGTVYNGEWKKDKCNGHGTMNYSSGTKKTGEWKDWRFLG